MKAQPLSIRAGLAPGHVGLIINGRVKGNVSPETLRKIAEAAGVDYEWLATGQGSPELQARDVAARAPREAGGVEPVLAEVSNWPELLAEARRLGPDVQPWTWDTLASSRPWLDQPLTPALLVSLARVIAAHVPPPARRGR